MKRYILDVLLSQFGTSLLFHVQFQLFLLDLHIDFSGGMSGGLVFHVFQNFPQFVLMHTVKDFSVVNEVEADVFLEFFPYFYDPADVGNRSLVPLPFLKLEHLKFMVHGLLKLGLENFEQYFASVWDECNCTVVSTFLALPFFVIGMKTVSSPVATAEFSNFAGRLSAVL